MSQGVINGTVTRLINNPEKLREFMSDKTEEQKRLARSHARTVMALIRKGKK